MQAEHLATLLALAYPHHVSLEKPLRGALLKRRDDVLNTLATLARRAVASERGPAMPTPAPPITPGLYGLPSAPRPLASDPPLTLPPASPLSQRTLNTPVPAPRGAATTGALVLKTPGGPVGAGAGPPALPWRLVLQAVDLLCVALSAEGGDAENAVRLWPPGQSSAAAQLQSQKYGDTLRFK